VNYRYLQVFLFTFCVLFPLHLSAGVSGQVEISVSIPPQKWLCEQLGGKYLKINLLIDKGQEPHGFEPSPRQIQSLSRSKVYFTTGMEFEQEIVRRLQTGAPKLQIADTSKNIEKIPMDHDGHEHSAREVLDPHVWLSPPNLKSMAAVMAKSLVAMDPENQKVYENNLSDLNTRLDTLDRKVAKELDDFQGASFFVFHPAFGYFANRYHLEQVAVEMGGKAPTPRQLLSLIKKARADGVKVIFVQPQFDPRSAEKIAVAISGKVVALDPLAENSVDNIQIMAVKIAEALAGQKK